METPPPWSTPESSPPDIGDTARQLKKTFQYKNSPGLSSRRGSNEFQRTRLQTFIIVTWTVALIFGGLWWLLDGERQSIVFNHSFNVLPGPPSLDGLRFIDAGHPYIRYVGRWASSPDKTQKDGCFPGVYFDFTFNGSNTILVSLHNTNLSARLPSSASKAVPSLPLLMAANASQAEPISLLARVDHDDYIVLPNASSIVLIRKGNLEPDARHEVRIIAPMFRGEVVETLQVEGIWIDEEGQLLPPEPDLAAKAPKTDATVFAHPQRKMLEIVTDLLGSLAGRDKRESTRSRGSILSGVVGWEYLLGEMFGVDHVTIGMDGMCLMQDCIGGRGSPAGLGDVFFQSGPIGSPQYSQPWLFEGYVPEVMNAGVFEGFRLGQGFHSEPLWGSPIFVMRPLRGQLEHVTQSVVDRLRSEGDLSVFWRLDTSGWLNTDEALKGPAEDQDFFLDEESSSKQWRLTERGNQRVAILLHTHVCQYLATDADRCAFVPLEVYQTGYEQAGEDD
ncbi:hypothetical protein D0Z07_1666 [Hyphodiscus hymeniophilus]|uniref:Uncharacterized protein n=1 Tax=Hyphodiscus hymeniophilus TaxID=353542 RepID=A0A9P6VNI8_9HELO|nr:hypothetical protein D0Z07_1666 [Hyphodiscus hymeniophilus]